MFSKKFFDGNRLRVQQALPNHLLVLSANSLMQSSADVAFPFRQDSSFWYLTGIDEPDVVLLIDTKKGESTLLLPALNAYQREWESGLTKDEMADISGVTSFDSVRSLARRLRDAKKAGYTIGYLKALPPIVKPFGFYSNPSRKKVQNVIKKIDPEPVDIRLTLAQLRQVKQPEEIAAITQAVSITARTLNDAKNRLSEYKNEKDIERTITASFFANGSDGHAYEPIVAHGKNAAVIHYQKNNAPLIEGQLLMLDVGARAGKYGADISRTWAVGMPSQRQRDLHTMILDMHETALSKLKPGVVIREYQKSMEKKAQSLQKKLGITVKKYPHLISHFLGIDTHDAGDYDSPLEENTVLTVEPGVYLPNEGIGVRVEDNVVITKHGVQNLSQDIPRDL